jgi:hypothetical protein
MGFFIETDSPELFATGPQNAGSLASGDRGRPPLSTDLFSPGATRAAFLPLNIARLPELMQRLVRVSPAIRQLIHTIGDNGRELRSLLAQFRVLRNLAFNAIASAL